MKTKSRVVFYLKSGGNTGTESYKPVIKDMLVADAANDITSLLSESPQGFLTFEVGMVGELVIHPIKEVQSVEVVPYYEK